MILDSCFLLVLLLVIYLSYKRGFFSALSGFVCYLVSAGVTYVYTSTVAQFLYEKVIRNLLIEQIKKNIFNGKAYHEDSKWFDYVYEASKVEDKASDIAAYIVDTYFKNLLLQLTQAVVGVLMFVLLSVLLSFLFRLLTGALNHSKGLGSINHLFGGVVGVLKGGLLVAVLGLVMSFVKDAQWSALPDVFQQQLKQSEAIAYVQETMLPMLMQFLFKK